MPLPPLFRQELKLLSIDGLTIFRGAIIRLDKNATGETLKSLSVRVRYNRDRSILTYYAVDTLEYRLFGRKEGIPPPIDPLIKWINAKGLSINPYALQQSIGDEGTQRPPVPYFETVEEKLLPLVDNFFNSQEVSVALFQKLDNFFRT